MADREGTRRYRFETLTDMARACHLFHSEGRHPQYHWRHLPSSRRGQTSPPSRRSVTSAAIGLRSLRVRVMWEKSG